MKTVLPARTTPEQLDQYVSDMRDAIDRALPPGAVVPQHTSEGHFYGVPSGAVHSSVTGKLNAVKDESIQNWTMNLAVQFVEDNIPRIIRDDGGIDLIKAAELFDSARKHPRLALQAAGDIGTQVHDRREKYFQYWIDSNVITGIRPPISLFMKKDDDPRLTAGMLALDKFLEKTGYIPIRTEVMVYSDKYEVAGMLDDIGIMKHNGKWRLTLLDLKTSNQMKAHYWLQVALYHMMFKEITGITPAVNCILKVNKEYPTYTLEIISNMRRVVSGAKNVLKVYDLMQFIKGERKNIGKKVLSI
jgi:hypothetical protein